MTKTLYVCLSLLICAAAQAGEWTQSSFKDFADGQFLDGGNNYRLTVPANIRVQQYWSAVVYDCASHAFTRDLFGKRPLPTFRFYGELTRSSTRRSNCRILRWSSRKAAETGCDDAPIRSSGAA